MLCYNKNYQNKFDENLNKGTFINTYKFSNHIIKKFILLLRKGAFPGENIDDLQKIT